MRSRVAAGLLLGAGLGALLVAQTTGDFRFSNWGDSAAQVRVDETATFHHLEGEEMAFMDSSIEGIRGGVIYLFEHDALVRGLYVSRNEYHDGEGVLGDYERMRRHLAELLGEEGEEERRWLDETLREEPDRLAEAIAAGHIRVATRWTRDQTHVELVMTGREGGVFLRALFQPTS